MANKIRNIPPHSYVHLMIRGNNKRCVFKRSAEYAHFMQLIFRYKIRFGFLLHHYALMKNHPHLSIYTHEDTNVSKVMQGLQLTYGNYHRKRYTYVGHLWQGRFKSIIIKDDAQLVATAMYIESNPVEAGIVKDPKEYPWGSYRYYAFGEDNPLVDPNPLYLELGKTPVERQKAYRILMAERIKRIKENKNT